MLWCGTFRASLWRGLLVFSQFKMYVLSFYLAPKISEIGYRLLPSRHMTKSTLIPYSTRLNIYCTVFLEVGRLVSKIGKQCHPDYSPCCIVMLEWYNGRRLSIGCIDIHGNLCHLKHVRFYFNVSKLPGVKYLLNSKIYTEPKKKVSTFVVTIISLFELKYSI